MNKRDMSIKNLSIVSFGTVFLCTLFLISVGAGCAREQENNKTVKHQPNPLPVPLPPNANLLVTIPDSDYKPPKAIPGHGPDPAAGEHDPHQVTFNESGSAVAYVAILGGKFQVVHNLNRGKEYVAVSTIVFSPDGKRVAYPAAGSDGKWRMVIDGKEDMPFDTLLPPRFSSDSRHVAYQAKNADKWFIVVDNTPNEGTIASYIEPEFSSDSKIVAYVEAAASNDKMRLIISDLKFNKIKQIWSIGDLFSVTSKNKTRIAADNVVGTKHRIIDFRFATHDAIHEGRQYDLIEKLTVSDDGKSLAYCVVKGEKRLIVFDGREEPLPDGRLREIPVIRPDRKGVGILFVTIDSHFFLHQSFFNRSEKGKIYNEAFNLTYSKDGSYAYEAKTGNNWFVVVNGTEGPAFERIYSPQFSPDGKLVVYRAKMKDKRLVVVSERSGKTIRQYPSYDQVFDAKFTDDGKSVTYGVKDGNRLAWIVEKL